MAEVILTDHNFTKEVILSEIPVLVDFHATWCGPCQMMAPVVAEIAEEYDGKIKVCKVDVDQCPRVSARYGIISVPTFMVFSHGNIVNIQPGAVPKEILVSMIS